VAQPVETSSPVPRAREDEPPLDPEAIPRAYQRHRARRAAKAKRHREKRWAGVRFWLVLALVFVVAVVLATRTLGEIERVFGL
jgi:anti-sigma-K factor RskA